MSNYVYIAIPVAVFVAVFAGLIYNERKARRRDNGRR